jgi:hypothetical protein
VGEDDDLHPADGVEDTTHHDRGRPLALVRTSTTNVEAAVNGSRGSDQTVSEGLLFVRAVVPDQIVQSTLGGPHLAPNAPEPA